jgi:hypothetical protein
MGSGGTFPPGGEARPWRDADHYLHQVSWLRMGRSYTSSTPQAPSLRVAGQLYFLPSICLQGLKKSRRTSVRIGGPRVRIEHWTSEYKAGVLFDRSDFF